MKQRVRRALVPAFALVALPGVALASVPAAAQGVPAAQETRHVVQAGETLNGIANRAGVSAADLARANNLAPPYVVKLGETLVIPRRRQAEAPDPSPARGDGHYTVTSGETLNGIANRTGVSASTIARANNLEAPFVLRAGETLTIPGGSRTSPAPANPAPASRAVTPAPQPTAQTAGRSNAASTETYTVSAGETLGGIANRTGVPRVLIAEANGLTEPFVVRAGQTLHIPRTRHHVVGTGDTGFSVALQYGVDWNQIALANGIEADAPLRPGQELLIPSMLNPPASSLPGPSAPAPAATAPSPAPASRQSRFQWPVRGPIRRGFATGTNYHDGIDITAARGTVVRAADAGTVRFAAMEPDQFGNLVVIDHGNNVYTAYAFLSRIMVRQGAHVDKGERIGLVGDTGLAQGNELHFEIRKNGSPVNPMDELPPAP